MKADVLKAVIWTFLCMSCLFCTYVNYTGGMMGFAIFTSFAAGMQFNAVMRSVQDAREKT